MPDFGWAINPQRRGLEPSRPIEVDPKACSGGKPNTRPWRHGDTATRRHWGRWGYEASIWGGFSPPRWRQKPALRGTGQSDLSCPQAPTFGHKNHLFRWSLDGLPGMTGPLARYGRFPRDWVVMSVCFWEDAHTPLATWRHQRQCFFPVRWRAARSPVRLRPGGTQKYPPLPLKGGGGISSPSDLGGSG